MTWIHHNGDLFNLDRFGYISCVGDYDISISPGLSADTDDYFVLEYKNEEDRDDAFGQIRSMLFSKNL